MFVDFEGEVSLYFSGWHTHLESTVDGYKTLKEILNLIIENEACTITAYEDNGETNSKT